MILLELYYLILDVVIWRDAKLSNNLDRCRYI